MDEVAIAEAGNDLIDAMVAAGVLVWRIITARQSRRCVW